MGREEARRLLLAQKTSIIDKCKGCDRINGQFCSAYLFPDKKWRLGDCNLASHIIERIDTSKEKIRVGQQKQKHRKKK